MRVLSTAIVVAAAVAISLAAVGAGHASAAMLPLTHTLLQQASPTQVAVPPHGGSRVGVQVVVLGIAGGLVLVVGTAAYLIRRRLGLTPPPPGEPPAAGH